MHSETIQLNKHETVIDKDDLEQLERQVSQLEKAMNIVRDTGSYEQQLINDALYESGYYIDDDENEQQG